MVSGAMALAACGSSSGSAGSESSASGKPTGEEIRIGTVGGYSGPNAANVAGSKETIEAWAKWVNDNGGLAGHPVKVFVE